MRGNTICDQIVFNPQLGYLRLQRMPILPSQCHLCKRRMPFMQTMPFVHMSQCHLCTQCQLCAQCHLCMLYHTNYASGAQLALLHIWHCEWHCVMLYYAHVRGVCCACTNPGLRTLKSPSLSPCVHDLLWCGMAAHSKHPQLFLGL